MGKASYEVYDDFHKRALRAEDSHRSCRTGRGGSRAAKGYRAASGHLGIIPAAYCKTARGSGLDHWDERQGRRLPDGTSARGVLGGRRSGSDRGNACARCVFGVRNGRLQSIGYVQDASHVAAIRCDDARLLQRRYDCRFGERSGQSALAGAFEVPRVSPYCLFNVHHPVLISATERSWHHG